MAIITGTPVGTITAQEDIYLEGAPNVYYQDYANGHLLKNPDSDGFYWNLSGTTAYPVYQLGCYNNVVFGEDVTVNAVRCDAVGDKDSVQRRNYLELTFEVQTAFPLSSMAALLKTGATTTNGTEHTEKMGIGPINNNTFYRVYLPKVYDEDTGDYVSITLHKAKVVGPFSWSFLSGENWKISGLTFRGYVDEDLPTAQQFATIVRVDPSVL